jgi:hypothetical protein
VVGELFSYGDLVFRGTREEFLTGIGDVEVFIDRGDLGGRTGIEFRTCCRGSGDLGGIVEVVGIACVDKGLDLEVTPGRGLEGIVVAGFCFTAGLPGDLQLLTTALLTRFVSIFCPKSGMPVKADTGINAGLFRKYGCSITSSTDGLSSGFGDRKAVIIKRASLRIGIFSGKSYRLSLIFL